MHSRPRACNRKLTHAPFPQLPEPACTAAGGPQKAAFSKTWWSLGARSSNARARLLSAAQAARAGAAASGRRPAFEIELAPCEREAWTATELCVNLWSEWLAWGAGVTHCCACKHAWGRMGSHGAYVIGVAETFASCIACSNARAHNTSMHFPQTTPETPAGLHGFEALVSSRMLTCMHLHTPTDDPDNPCRTAAQLCGAQGCGVAAVTTEFEAGDSSTATCCLTDQLPVPPGELLRAMHWVTLGYNESPSV